MAVVRAQSARDAVEGGLAELLSAPGDGVSAQRSQAPRGQALIAATALSKDRATPRGTASTELVATSIRSAAEELRPTRPGSAS